jgi:hypothetical protein
MPSLVKALRRWYWTVRALMNNRAPISGFDRLSRAIRVSGLTRWLTVLTTAGPSAGFSQSSSGMNKKTGPADGLKGHRVGPHEGRGNVLGAGGLIGPFHPRLR